jgi:hypothetical protein
MAALICKSMACLATGHGTTFSNRQSQSSRKATAIVAGNVAGSTDIHLRSDAATRVIGRFKTRHLWALQMPPGSRTWGIARHCSNRCLSLAGYPARSDGTQVTGARLAHLEGLTSLQSLYLFDTQVTGAGLTKLCKALPTCQIIGP